MRQRRRLLLWGTAASLFAGLATAATTLHFNGQTIAGSLLSWLAGGPSGAAGGTMMASRDESVGAVRPPVVGDGAHIDDDGPGLTIRPERLTPYRLADLSPPDTRIAPDGAFAINWPGATVPGVIGGAPGVTGERGDTVVSSAADGTPPEGVVAAADPTATATLNRGASALPFPTGFASAASQASSDGGGSLPSAGGSTGGGSTGGSSTGGGSTGGSTGGGSTGGGSTGGSTGGGLPGGGGIGGGGTGGGGTGGGGTGGTGDSGATVPEPATWLLMIAGFGLVGVGQRRSGRGYSGFPANSASR